MGGVKASALASAHLILIQRLSWPPGLYDGDGTRGQGREDIGIFKAVIIRTWQMRKQRFRRGTWSRSATRGCPGGRCSPSLLLSDTDAWTQQSGLSFLGPLPVSELMGDGESQREARVFIDVAAPVRLAHSRQVRQTQGLAGAVDSRTDVFPESRGQRCIGTRRQPQKHPQRPPGKIRVLIHTQYNLKSRVKIIFQKSRWV